MQSAAIRFITKGHILQCDFVVYPIQRAGAFLTDIILQRISMLIHQRHRRFSGRKLFRQFTNRVNHIGSEINKYNQDARSDAPAGRSKKRINQKCSELRCNTCRTCQAADNRYQLPFVAFRSACFCCENTASVLQLHSLCHCS